MLICLAGLRSTPEDIYEAAEMDRASPFRQFWTIALPMVLPFLMLAMLFLVPIVAFTIILRKHLLRGITFGAGRK